MSRACARISEEMVVEESQLIECQLRRLVACDMQGGLIGPQNTEFHTVLH